MSLPALTTTSTLNGGGVFAQGGGSGVGGSDSGDTWLIVGIVLGVLVLITIIVVVVLLRKRHQRKEHKIVPAVARDGPVDHAGSERPHYETHTERHGLAHISSAKQGDGGVGATKAAPVITQQVDADPQFLTSNRRSRGSSRRRNRRGKSDVAKVDQPTGRLQPKTEPVDVVVGADTHVTI